MAAILRISVARTVAAFGLCAALVFLDATPVSASGSPAAIGWSHASSPANPFCAVVGEVVPWDLERNAPSDGLSDTYAVFLWAQATREFSARMTLVDSASAFTAEIPTVTVTGSSAGQNVRWPYLISFDRPVALSDEFVDSVSVDGGPATNCPSFVQTVRSPKDWDAAKTPERSAFGRTAARFLQKLPPLSCGSVYTYASTKHTYEPLVGRYGDLRKSVEVEVFIDSNGSVVDTRIWNSSGVEGLDDAGLAGAQRSSFKPAAFLCTPVVSISILQFDYQP